MNSKKNANQICLRSFREYKKIKNELKDEQMLSFIADTLLDKFKPVYKNATISLNEPYSSQIFVLPALQMPVIPEPYDKEIEQFINRKNKVPDKLTKRNRIDSLDYSQISLDGFQYNPKDFQFPISPIEKEKLARLAQELDFPKSKKKKSRTILPLLNQDKIESAGIRKNEIFQPERKFSSRLQVAKKIENKFQEKSASNSISLNKLKLQDIIKKKNELQNFSPEKLDEVWEDIMKNKLKYPNLLAHESEKYKNLVTNLKQKGLFSNQSFRMTGPLGVELPTEKYKLIKICEKRLNDLQDKYKPGNSLIKNI